MMTTTMPHQQRGVLACERRYSAGRRNQSLGHRVHLVQSTPAFAHLPSALASEHATFSTPL